MLEDMHIPFNRSHVSAFSDVDIKTTEEQRGLQLSGGKHQAYMPI